MMVMMVLLRFVIQLGITHIIHRFGSVVNHGLSPRQAD